MVSWELFRDQPQQYRDSVIPPKASLRLAVEAASSMVSQFPTPFLTLTERSSTDL